jgi:hypothetical protein
MSPGVQLVGCTPSLPSFFATCQITEILILCEFQLSSGYHIDPWTTFDLIFCLLDLMAVAFIFIWGSIMSTSDVAFDRKFSRSYLEIDSVYKQVNV